MVFVSFNVPSMLKLECNVVVFLFIQYLMHHSISNVDSSVEPRPYSLSAQLPMAAQWQCSPTTDSPCSSKNNTMGA